MQQEIWASGRTLKTVDGFPSFKELEKYLEDGIPVLWGLHSTQWFNDTANRRTAMRKSSQSDMWKKIIATADEKVENMARPQRGENLHICIIHGFNKITGEIAFTDSWGPLDLPKDGYLQKRRSIFQVVVVGLLNINNHFLMTEPIIAAIQSIDTFPIWILVVSVLWIIFSITV